jgi:AraC-like DNA-binding protein
VSRENGAEVLEPPTIVAYAPREKSKAFVRTAFPKRRWRVVLVKDIGEFRNTVRRTLVDAVLVDISSMTAGERNSGDALAAAGISSGTVDDTWKIAGLAHEFPSSPFFGITSIRPTDAPSIARCVSLEFCDILAEGVDDIVAKDVVAPRTFSARFMSALAEPPASLGLKTPMQRATWRSILAGAGRPVRTAALASEVGVSREHLSRHFSTPGAPNLKRVIDLVRMISAAELAKNPGLDIRDVAKILGFASSSHLAVTAQRVLGTRPASLSRLRTVDLIDRFTQGRTRSRG